jgi:pimeloyl-ACP methyl ester carboxylesterase
MWESMTFEERARLAQYGVLHVPSQYGEPTPIAKALIEDGRAHLLLDDPIPLNCPVRLLHGQADPDVPWELALRTAERLTGSDVEVILIKDGDHRLSRARDLALLQRTVAALLAPDRGEALAETGP